MVDVVVEVVEVEVVVVDESGGTDDVVVVVVVVDSGGRRRSLTIFVSGGGGSVGHRVEWVAERVVGDFAGLESEDLVGEHQRTRLHHERTAHCR